MKDSEIVTLGSVTSWFSGGTPDRSNEDYWSGSIPWISASTLKDLEIYDSPQRVTIAAARAGSKMAPIGATLILVRGMALHRELRAGIVTQPVCFNQDIKALVPAPAVLPRFLTYAIYAQGKRILDLVSSAGSGTGVLDTSLLRRIPIWLPGQRRQAEVVGILDDVEQHLVRLERLIAKKQAIRQGVAQQLLTGETRLPGFTEKWEKVRLGDVATVSRGASPRPIASTRWFSDSSNVGWVRISDLGRSDGIILRTTTQRLSADGIARSRFLPAGTLIMSIAATVGVPIITGIPACIHDGFVALEQLRRVNQLYLLYLLKSMEGELRSAGQTGSQANVNTGIVGGLPIWLPPQSEQSAIAEVLCDADKEIAALKHRLAKASAVKQGLMQELLTERAQLPLMEALA